MTRQGRQSDMAIIREILRTYKALGGFKPTARALGCNKYTVKQYVRWAKEHGFLQGELPSEKDLAKAWELDEKPSAVSVNVLETVKGNIQDWLKEGLPLVRVQEMLQEQHGWKGSYSALKRYTAPFRDQKSAYVRLEVGPGEEAQVDYGLLGRLWDETRGMQAKAWVFMMTLSHSRHMYAEVVFTQEVKTWVACHRRAFEFFNGVPRKILIDNLKSGIVKAALYDPLANRTYVECANHYGFVISPCRIATPRHKGKVERGVPYVRNSFFKGRSFQGRADANRQLLDWVLNKAGLRDHGTTRLQPLAVFETVEKKALLPLPPAPYHPTLFKIATLHPDCRVIVEGSYYSAPYRLRGKKLLVQLTDTIVDIYFNHECVASHARATHKGTWRTNPSHYPPEKMAFLERTPQWCLKQAQAIGPNTHQLIHLLLERSHPLDHLRKAQGILRLREKYLPSRLEAACQRALHYGNFTYQSVKNILQKNLDQNPLDPTPDTYIKQQKSFDFARPVEDFLRALAPNKN